MSTDTISGVSIWELQNTPSLPLLHHSLFLWNATHHAPGCLSSLLRGHIAFFHGLLLHLPRHVSSWSSVFSVLVHTSLASSWKTAVAYHVPHRAPAWFRTLFSFTLTLPKMKTLMFFALGVICTHKVWLCLFLATLFKDKHRVLSDYACPLGSSLCTSWPLPLLLPCVGSQLSRSSVGDLGGIPLAY